MADPRGDRLIRGVRAFSARSNSGRIQAGADRVVAAIPRASSASSRAWSLDAGPAARDVLPLARQLDSLAGLAEVAGKVAHAAEHMGVKLMVAADPASASARPKCRLVYRSRPESCAIHPVIAVGAAAVKTSRLSAPTSLPNSRGATDRLEVPDHARVQVPTAGFEISGSGMPASPPRRGPAAPGASGTSWEDPPARQRLRHQSTASAASGVLAGGSLNHSNSAGIHKTRTQRARVSRSA